MLKRIFYLACFISSSFIAMAIASGNTIINKKLVIDPTMPVKTTDHHFDSSGLCTCIPFIAKEELLHAPRIQINKNAAPFVKDYIKKNGFALGKTKKRTAAYFSIMDSVFTEKEIPVELKYLAFIESGLQHNLISYAGAIGPWALMPKAAKQYGLKISRHNDERLNYYKSTYAAASLLTDLYKQYGDWLLVIAAYNCGPGGVQKAIKKSGSRNYWVLQNFLPKETRMHVKKFIAVHYYFEAHGSLVTLTKAETEKHVKAVESFVCKQQEKEKADSLSIVVVKQ